MQGDKNNYVYQKKIIESKEESLISSQKTSLRSNIFSSIKVSQRESITSNELERQDKFNKADLSMQDLLSTYNDISLLLDKENKQVTTPTRLASNNYIQNGQDILYNPFTKIAKKLDEKVKGDLLRPVPQKNNLSKNLSNDRSNTILNKQEVNMQELLCSSERGDSEDFFAAVKGTVLLKGGGREVMPETQQTAFTMQNSDDFQNMLEKQLEFSLECKGEYIEGHVVGIDELTMQKLRAGLYSPEKHLDLHGLNAIQAYQALVIFIKKSWYKGMRTVLLIPGRGKNSPSGIGVLREKIQFWLTQEPFKRVVLAFCTALPKDGGPGTIYVLLRKYKKKGKIYWEIVPSDPDLF